MILVRAHPCWVPVGTSTALCHASSCVWNCRGARRAVGTCVAVTDISSHPSARRSEIPKRESSRETSGPGCCECTQEPPPFHSSHRNRGSVLVGTRRKQQPSSVKVERTEKPPTLTQHCHPQNRWRCTQATQTQMNLQLPDLSTLSRNIPCPHSAANLREQSGLCQGHFRPSLATEVHFGLLGF